MANTYLPISFRIKGKSCLVVGGGLVALRKVDTLLEYETEITVIAPEIIEKLDYYGERGRIKIEKREYKSPEAGAYGLVIAASNDQAVNRRVSDDCRGSGVLVNVADDPEYCDFIFPAIVRRDSLTAAISTDGKAPFVAGHLRIILGNIFPEHWSQLMKHAADFRKRVQQRWAGDSIKKQLCYTAFLDADWKTLLKQKESGAVEEELQRLLENPTVRPETDDEDAE